MATLGKAGFVLKGAWSAVVTYDPLEVVLYSGKIYAAKQSSINSRPDQNPSDWMLWAGSPIVSVESISGGYALTVENADGTTETYNIMTGGASGAVTATLVISAADWNGGTTVTKNVPEVGASSIVWSAPDSSSIETVGSCQVFCTAQGNGTLTYEAKTTPDVDVTFNLVVM